MTNNKTETDNNFKLLATTKLPIFTGRLVDAVVFGSDPDDPDVVALVHKNPDVVPDKALVRLHSACITSEVLGSTKCDCAEQLDTAISLASESDWGIVVYLLKHEGRGIGLVNKIRAYSLQYTGLDTVDANLELGFGADDRNFEPAVKALELLGVKKVELLTNNPDKVAALRSSGFDVVKRIAMDVPITDFNRDYLIKKQEYFGHLPLRCPCTELLTVEAAASLFDSQCHHHDKVMSAIVIHVESADSDQTLPEKNALIIRVANLIKGLDLLNTPLISRMSEDRFLVCLPGTDLDLAENMALKLHGALQSALASEKTGMPTNTSIGVAESLVSGGISSLSKLAANAVDRALAEGGSQVSVYSEDRLCTA